MIDDYIKALTKVVVVSEVERREREAEAEVVARLPRTGPFLVRHPRLLRLVFKLRPSLRPVVWHG